VRSLILTPRQSKTAVLHEPIRNMTNLQTMEEEKKSELHPLSNGRLMIVFLSFYMVIVSLTSVDGNSHLLMFRMGMVGASRSCPIWWSQ